MVTQLKDRPLTGFRPKCVKAGQTWLLRGKLLEMTCCSGNAHLPPAEARKAWQLHATYDRVFHISFFFTKNWSAYAL
jgi:hypothetical protein